VLSDADLEDEVGRNRILTEFRDNASFSLQQSMHALAKVKEAISNPPFVERTPVWNSNADIIEDSIISVLDLILTARYLGT
jgi:hypothetical protein